MDLWQIFGYITGAIGLIGGSVYYLRFTATKANIEGKNETIETQNGQLDALKDEVVRLNIDRESYKKQADALRDVAQQTPQIIQLTKAITNLTVSINKQHTENTKERQQTTQILKQLLTAVKKGVTNDEDERSAASNRN
jgi:cell division protein FtsL